MKKTAIGILAHVDAGKTTLSEAILYCTGTTGTLGRVDHGSAYLDNFELERKRGITIFSKQAVINYNNMRAVLLDTPGHVDFSAETERVLDVLDCAIMVISAPEGVQSHTRTLWKLLKQRNIPVFIFVNKMDLEGSDRRGIVKELSEELGGVFFDYREPDLESLAMCDEDVLEEYLDSGVISRESVRGCIEKAGACPCWFGAALKLDGVEDFLEDVAELAPESRGEESGQFGASVFKVTRDDQGNRLTHMKVTSGTLQVRDSIESGDSAEKVSQLRVYSGTKFTSVQSAGPGDVVAAVGLTFTLPGMGLGVADDGEKPVLEPVLTYTIILPDGTDLHRTMAQLRQLEEEDPQLRLGWDHQLKCLQVQLMGPIQLEVIHQLILDRFGIDVSFGPGKILYRETIEEPVEGVGHYEPLRHYAEVHLVISPGEPGSGIVIETGCPEDELDKNWQRLIITHLYEKPHLGVLTGSPITDVVITLTAGKAHKKHTEGGDFRQATYRAVRQGLMEARSVLLEPWYSFRIELPEENTGRAISDLERMGGEYGAPEIEGRFTVLTGSAPVSAMREYPQELASYSKGMGRIFLTLKGYAPCAEADKVIEEFAYDPEADVENTPDSVFCSHGAGRTVKWYDVKDCMHLPSTLNPPEEKAEELRTKAAGYISRTATDKELMAIFEKTYGPVKRNLHNEVSSRTRRYGSDSDEGRGRPLRKKGENASQPAHPRFRPRSQQEGPEYLLIDGYNIIFAWDKLKETAAINIDSAREQLIDILRNYQGFCQTPVIVVFDAYKVKGNPGSTEKLGGLTVVYTKEAETADTYIEKASYKLGKKHYVRVATSDRLEQMIIMGNGALRISAAAFEAEVNAAEESIRRVLEEYTIKENRNYGGNRIIIDPNSI